jgi:hypothetical protein
MIFLDQLQNMMPFQSTIVHKPFPHQFSQLKIMPFILIEDISFNLDGPQCHITK